MTMATPTNGTPIKQRLLDDLRRHSDPKGKVSATPAELARRYGLSAHDLQKNLFQLEQEGLLSLETSKGTDFEVKKIRLRRGALNEALLKARKPALSIPEKIRQWLLSQPSQLGGWIFVTPAELKAKLGFDPGDNGVPVAISDMQRHDKLEVRKQGARIIAMRLKPEEPVSSKLKQPEPIQTTPVTAAPVGEPMLVPTITRRVPDEPTIVNHLRQLRLVADNPYVDIYKIEAKELWPLLDYVSQLRNMVESTR